MTRRRSGEVLEFYEEQGRLVAVKAQEAEDPIGRVYGILRATRRTDEVIEELRGAVEGV